MVAFIFCLLGFLIVTPVSISLFEEGAETLPIITTICAVIYALATVMYGAETKKWVRLKRALTAIDPTPEQRQILQEVLEEQKDPIARILELHSDTFSDT